MLWSPLKRASRNRCLHRLNLTNIEQKYKIVVLSKLHIFAYFFYQHVFGKYVTYRQVILGLLLLIPHLQQQTCSGAPKSRIWESWTSEACGKTETWSAEQGCPAGSTGPAASGQCGKDCGSEGWPTFQQADPGDQVRGQGGHDKFTETCDKLLYWNLHLYWLQNTAI